LYTDSMRENHEIQPEKSNSCKVVFHFCAIFMCFMVFTTFVMQAGMTMRQEPFTSTKLLPLPILLEKYRFAFPKFLLHGSDSFLLESRYTDEKNSQFGLRANNSSYLIAYPYKARPSSTWQGFISAPIMMIQESSMFLEKIRLDLSLFEQSESNPNLILLGQSYSGQLGAIITESESINKTKIHWRLDLKHVGPHEHPYGSLVRITITNGEIIVIGHIHDHMWAQQLFFALCVGFCGLCLAYMTNCLDQF
jgi:hypothetical protein